MYICEKVSVEVCLFVKSGKMNQTLFPNSPHPLLPLGCKLLVCASSDLYHHAEEWSRSADSQYLLLGQHHRW